MKLLSAAARYFRKARGHRVLVNSVPKAGTHLVAKLLSQLPAGEPVRFHLGPELFSRNGVLPDPLKLGIDWPRPCSRHDVAFRLRSLDRGSFATTHAPHSGELRDLIELLGLKTILVLRDPRAVVVSHAFYIAGLESNIWHEHYRALGEPERVAASIRGLDVGGVPPLLDITSRFASALPWMDESFNYTTRFEKLVGPSGGGSEAEQLEELSRIAGHLEVSCGEETLAEIARVSFGGTGTFRRGRIDAWRESFDAEHVALFKELAGQLLIDLEYERDLDW